MQGIAWWKLRRELGRAVAPLWDRALQPLRHARTRSHDRHRSRVIRIHEGRLRPTTKVAIYVLYQPSGLTSSTLLGCDWLSGNGYAPLVVSNAPLAERDLQRLKDHSWLTVERPNLGYDFGAYRDGLWVLGQRGLAPDRLVLVNDSIWFPLSDDRRMLDDLEATPGLSGTVFVARTGRSSRNAHFQSFLLSVDGPCFRHAAFQAYWKGLLLSDTRRHVLRDGEKGFSQAMLTAGLAAAPDPAGEAMLRRIETESTSALHEILAYAAYDAPQDAAEGRALLAGFQPTEDWRGAVLAHCRRILLRAQPMGAFPVAGLRLMGLNFLKKGNNLPIYAPMRWQYLRAVRDGILPRPAPEILAEVEASRMDGRWTTDIDCQPDP